MSGAVYGVTVVVGGTAANHMSTITGMSIAVASGSGKEIAAEVLGVVVPGAGAALVKTAIKSPSGPTAGDLIDISAAIKSAVQAPQPISVALTVVGVLH